jgi:hypothetical protein
VSTLTTEIGLAAEMAEDPNDNLQIVTRFVTDWRED